MSKESLLLGKRGEAIAADYLETQGYKIIQVNFKNKLGQIDIIAKDKKVICFVEVKTRSSSRFGQPQEAIPKTKQHRIAKTAICFLKNNRLINAAARFDVVCVNLDNQNLKVNLIKDAFNLEGGYVS